MRTYMISILSVVCAVVIPAQGQAPQRIDMWQFGGVHLTSIATQGESGIACGDRGTIVVTDPTVLKWRRIFDTQAGDSTMLNRVEYVGPGLAIAVGTMGCIIRSTDNGATWERVNSGTNENLLAIAVVSIDRVICVGTGGTALVSTDQGRSWTEQTVPTALSFNDAFALPDGSVKAVGPVGLVGTLLPSSNTWSASVGTTDRTLSSCWFRDRQFGFAGAAREILQTTDGGASWSTASTINNGTITRLRRVGDRVFACGSFDGMVYVSNLSAWTSSYWMTDSVTVRDAAAVPSSPTLIYVIGDDGLIRSFDLTKPALNDVGTYDAPFYFDQMRASTGDRWFVGSSGSVHLLQANGRWTTVRDRDTMVAAVSRIDQANMTLLATYDGRIEWKFDADTTWYRATTPGTGLRAVRALSTAGDMWIVDGSRVLRAANPSEWSEVHVEQGVDLYDVENYAVRKAAVCGSGGTVLYTDNSGVTWTRSSVGVDAVLMDLDLDANGHGYVVGEGGTILRTSDAGVTFETVTGPRTTSLFTSVDHDPTTGLIVVVAADGSIFVRPTASSNWQQIRTYTQLQSVLIADGVITAAGEGGTIYRIPLNAVTVNEEEVPQLVVSPNPASAQVTVNLASLPEATQLDLVAVSGRIVTSIDVNREAPTVTLDLQAISAGSYYVMVYNTAGLLIGKAHVVK